jgi:histidine kinase-like protein
VFPLLTAMEEQRWSGLSVIYVCPLKALLNNLLPRLENRCTRPSPVVACAAAQAGDFVIAVHEIATNAVRHGSRLARLGLQIAGETAVQAEIRDSGHWPPGPPAVSAPGGAERACRWRAGSVMRS